MADETGDPTEGYKLGPPVPPPAVPPAAATASPRAAAAIARAKAKREKKAAAAAPAPPPATPIAAPAVPAVPPAASAASAAPAVPPAPAAPSVPPAPAATAAAAEPSDAAAPPAPAEKPRGLYATPLGEPGNQPWVVPAPEPYEPSAYVAPPAASLDYVDPYASPAPLPYVTPTPSRQPWGILIGLVALGIAIVVIVGVVLVGGLRPGTVEDPTAGGPNVPAPVNPGNPAPQPSEPPTAPSDPSKVTNVSGTGDALVPLVLPDGVDTRAVLVLTHDGQSTFFVTALASNKEAQRTLVYDTGVYDGKVLINNEYDRPTNLVRVRADGNWTITAISTDDVEKWSGGTATGKHDDVLLYTGPAGRARMSHKGESNFIVWSYGDKTDLLANEIDEWEGSEDWPAGPALISIVAHGPWEIEIR